MYLCDGARQLYSLFPHTKLIVSLRDPVVTTDMRSKHLLFIVGNRLFAIGQSLFKLRSKTAEKQQNQVFRVSLSSSKLMIVMTTIEHYIDI